MQYFLDLEKLSIKKLYEDEYETVEVFLPLDKIYDMSVRAGVTEVMNYLGEMRLPETENCHIIVKTDLQRIETDDASLVFGYIINELITDDKRIRDYLDIPRKLQKSLIGTQASLIELVNYPSKYKLLQITIMNTKGEGFNLAERID